MITSNDDKTSSITDAPLVNHEKNRKEKQYSGHDNNVNCTIEDT